MTRASRVAAVFDIDRTLVVGTSMEKIFLRWLVAHRLVRLRDMLAAVPAAALQVARYPVQGYLQYHGYLSGKPVGAVEEWVERCFQERIWPRVSREGMGCVKEHRSSGHFVALLSGSIEPLVRRLAAELGPDHTVCTAPASRFGVYTGRLAGKHVGGGQKPVEVARMAAEKGLDLAASYCYADHHTDAPMLELFGNPVTVNADARLRRIAERRGWKSVRFE